MNTFVMETLEEESKEFFGVLLVATLRSVKDKT
jgi:hypothetical protein